jgi:hypothetical protein
VALTTVTLVAIAGVLMTALAFRAELEQVRSATGNVPLAVGPVLVLGGERTRTEAALALDVVAVEGRELIASAGAAQDLVDLDRDCDEPGLRCVQPDPATTRGEARLATELARAEDWPALTVVTARWHVHRAQRHLEACLTIPFAVVGVHDIPPDAVPRRLLWREALGALDARLRPECRDLAP